MKELFQLLAKYQLTPNSHYLLYCLDNNDDMVLPIGHSTEMHRLKLQGYLDEKSNITPLAKSILVELSKSYFVQVKGSKGLTTSGEPGFRENVIKYRELFPAERQAGGRALRNSVGDIEQRLIWFHQSYPQYSWDTIFKATSKYLESMNGSYTYCQCSIYFIKKTEKGSHTIKGSQTISNLATWCELVEEQDDDSSEHPAMDFNRLA